VKVRLTTNLPELIRRWRRLCGERAISTRSFFSHFQSIGGTVHEGGLAYTGPDNTTSTTASNTPAKPKPYTVPTNPLTGRGYSDAAGAAAATFGATNLLTLA
jgi:hypothetical protein